MKKTLAITILFLSSILFLQLKKTSNSTPVLRTEQKISASGIHYSLFYQDKLKIDFETKRPDKKDPTIYLCIAAAFTKLTDYTIDGTYAKNGKAYNQRAINHTLGGAIKIINNTCEIFPTHKGKLINDSLLNLINAKKGSFFQQIQMIENGKSANFIDKKIFQRRGIAIFKNGSTAIIESKEAITLAVFAKDLVSMNVYNFLYTDMGSWDEGWIRKSNSEITIIGQNLSETKYQSNWIVFRK